MTQHSEHGGFITPTGVILDDGPVDTAYTRDVLANNAIHAYDMASCVRVNDVMKAGATGALGNGSSSYSFVRPYTFPVSLRADGSHFPLVVLIAARKAVGSNTDFCVSLKPHPHPSEGSDPPTPDDGTEWSCTFTASSTTTDWLTPSRNTIQLPASMMTGFHTFQTRDVEDGRYTSVTMAFLTLDIFTKNDDSSSGVKGVYVREFVG